ncbi:hypothetical protein GCM10009706_07310 [Curtobacterium citreum]|uniref:Uncharacterized protein n=1 Tax=Curtobacterium citreum TaxID=2036 RepID=A0ABT2HCP9_9MICO|nr:hypothetical protein [Curtobacterium citreum]MCS6521000.1 hypothetical protein [Curtobacterium citreum]GGL71528.1 hypothetical protein GCM10009706_07310 [Curtobacterium citreum]
MGERFRPQVGSIGLEARPVSATLVTMTKPSTPAAGPVTTAETDRWCGSVDPPAFARWLADRAVGAGPHLAPVVAVGRCPAGHLAARVLRPAALPLDRAFEELGVPTSGVAVTVSVPLLELAATTRAGALELGALGPDDVGLDDAGAVLVVDRPPGAARCCGDESDTEPLHGRRSDPDGARQLVLAARTVWDRVDAQDPARGVVDPLLDGVVDADGPTIRSVVEQVLGAAAPRPVRWARGTPAVADLEFAAPPPVPADELLDRVLRVVRTVLEQGVPVGRGRRIGLRRVLVGVAVASGLGAVAVTLG